MKKDETASIIIRVDKQMKTLMQKIARQDGRPLGNYLRVLMEQDIKKKEVKNEE